MEKKIIKERVLLKHIFVLLTFIQFSSPSNAQTQFSTVFRTGGFDMSSFSSGIVSNQKMSDQRTSGFVFAQSIFDMDYMSLPNPVGYPLIFTTDVNGNLDGFAKRYEFATDGISDIDIISLKSGGLDIGYFFLGEMISSDKKNYFFRTDVSGNEIWSMTYKFQRASGGYGSVGNWLPIQTSDGNILIIGDFNYTNVHPGKYNLVAMKLDVSTGNVIWEKHYETNTLDGGFVSKSLIETTPGEYIIIGGDRELSDIWDNFILKLTETGTSVTTTFHEINLPTNGFQKDIVFEEGEMTVSGNVGGSVFAFKIDTDLASIHSLSGTIGAMDVYTGSDHLHLHDAIYFNDRLNLYVSHDNMITTVDNALLVLENDGDIFNKTILEGSPDVIMNQLYKDDDAIYGTAIIFDLGTPFEHNPRLTSYSTIGNTCLQDEIALTRSTTSISIADRSLTELSLIKSIGSLNVIPVDHPINIDEVCEDCPLTHEDFDPISATSTDLCVVDDVTLTAPIVGVDNWVWFHEGIEIATTPSITVTEGGTYSVILFYDGDCSVELTINIASGVDLTDIDGKIYCLNSSYPLPDYDEGGSWSGTGVIEVGGNYYFSPLVVGTYTLTYCNESGCCADATVNVQSPEIEILDITGVCEGGSSGSITATVDGGFHDWTLLLDGLFYDEELSMDIVTFSSLSEGDYELKVTDSEGCTSTYEFSITSGGWHKQTVNTTGTESANDVVTDVYGNVYVVGTFSKTTEIHGGGNPNILIDSDGATEGAMYVAKYDDCGTLLWAAHSSGTVLSSGEGLILDVINGMVYVTGNLKNTAVFHSSESAGDLCVSGDTESVTAPTTKSGYIAQYDMNTGCLYFVDVYNDGVAQSTTSITVDESTGEIFVGGSYQPSLTSLNNYLFVRKYKPSVLYGALNTLGSIRWAAYDNTSTNPQWNQINNMDYDEGRKFLYAIGDYHGRVAVLTSQINHAGSSTDAFLLTIRDVGSFFGVYNLRGGNGSPNGFMTGEAVAFDSTTGAVYLTGSYNYPINNAFFFTGINALGSFGLRSNSYMLSGHINDSTTTWARHTIATPSTSGWVRGKDVTLTNGGAIFCNEFSGAGLSIAPGGGYGISYGFVGDTTASGHIGVISYTSSGIRNWANVTESISMYGADNHIVNAISADGAGNSFMAGAFRNTMSYNFGTPYSGDLVLSGFYGGYNACVLRVNNSSGELKSGNDIGFDMNETMNSFEVKLWPNPNDGSFFIEMDKSEELTEIRILDINGSVILKKIISETTTEVNLTNLSSGIYFVKLVRGEATRVEKIVIQ